MSPWVVCLVLTSALMHASWNAMLKGGGDRLRSISVMSLAASLASAGWALFLPIPHAGSWVYIVLSGVLHIVYNLLLVLSYRHGDLGLVYPIARGSSPMLVAMVAAVLAGERLDAVTTLGITLVSLGILALAFDRRGRGTFHLTPALLTGVSIAAFTIVDGLGSRRSGNANAYAAWLFATYGPPMMLTAIAVRRARTPRDGREPTPWWTAETLRSACGGIVALIAYAIVIWAASVSPMGPVSALRETSVVIAALLGWLLLNEPMPPQRLAACAVVALGTAFLGLSHT